MKNSRYVVMIKYIKNKFFLGEIQNFYEKMLKKGDKKQEKEIAV